MKATWNIAKQPHPDFPSREFPYTGGEDDKVEYYDFKAHPELIPEVLEDFKGWNKQAAVQTFYGLLESMNGSESHIETCDCAFRVFNNKNPKQLAGRLMVMYRNVEVNLLNGPSTALGRSFIEQLEKQAPEFPHALFEIYGFPQWFPAAFPGVGVGEELLAMVRESNITCIEFTVTGATLGDAWKHLDIAFRGMWEASKWVNHWIALFDPIRLEIRREDTDAK